MLKWIHTSWLLLLCMSMVACQAEALPESGPTAVDDPLVLGATIYARECAECHGANLEGEPNWQQPNADGTFRAPPHDATGHTWHHSDQHLWERVKYGTAVLPPQLQAQSNMPAYDGVLSDAEITAVLTFIKQSWPADVQQIQREISEQAQ